MTKTEDSSETGLASADYPSARPQLSPLRRLLARATSCFNWSRYPRLARGKSRPEMEDEDEVISGQGIITPRKSPEERILEALRAELSEQLSSFSDKLVRQLRRLSVLSEEQSRLGAGLDDRLEQISQLLQQNIHILNQKSNLSEAGASIEKLGVDAFGELQELKEKDARAESPRAKVATDTFAPPVRLSQGLSLLDKLYKLVPLISQGQGCQRSEIGCELLSCCIDELEEILSVQPVVQIGQQYDPIASEVAGVYEGKGTTGDVYEILRQGYKVKFTGELIRKAVVTVIKVSSADLLEVDQQETPNGIETNNTQLMEPLRRSDPLIEDDDKVEELNFQHDSTDRGDLG